MLKKRESTNRALKKHANHPQKSYSQSCITTEKTSLERFRIRVKNIFNGKEPPEVKRFGKVEWSRKQRSDIQKWLAPRNEFAMNVATEAIVTPKAPKAILPAQSHGIISGLACKCSNKNDMDFLIKQNHIICGSCGREVSVLPPLLGIFKAVCSCCASPSVKTTFVLDTRGIYTCTWCGQTR